jgi:GT2 family glycosyltransferase
VLTYNAPYWTERCFESLFRWTSVPYELIVVDNGSDPETLAVLDRYDGVPGFQIVRNGYNAGFPAGNNIGLRHATAQEVLFLNSDVVVTPNWLASLSAVLDARPDVGAVGPRTNIAQGLQGGIFLHSLTDDALRRFGSHFNWHDPTRWYEVDTLSGFAMLVRRSLLQEVGPFDERFEEGTGEDRELCGRIRGADRALLCAGDCFVFHAGHASFLESGVNFAHKMALNRIRYPEGGSSEGPTMRTNSRLRPNPAREDSVIIALTSGSRYLIHEGVLHPVALRDAERLLPYATRNETVSDRILDQFPVGDPIFFIRSWGAAVYLFALGRRHRLTGNNDRITRIPGISVLRPEDLEIIPEAEPLNVDAALKPISTLPLRTPRSLIAGFEQRLVGTDYVVSRIQRALELRQPLSLVRIDEDEARVLNGGVVDVDRSALDADPSRFTRGTSDEVRVQLVEAVRDADVVGLTTEQDRRAGASLLEDVFTHFNIAPQHVSSARVNLALIGIDSDAGDRLPGIPPLRNLLRDRRVAVVGPRAAEAERRQRDLGWQVTVATTLDGADDVRRALKMLSAHRDEFDVALVAAGVPGIILCPLLARETERVAIDFGMGLDHLLSPRSETGRATTASPDSEAISVGQGSQRQAVVVTGMHRSGTSALARLLSTLGLALPQTPMGPSWANELGHWGESERIWRLHGELLASAGSSWDDVSPFPSSWRRSPIGDQYSERMVELLREEYPGSAPFVLKDPRICRLVPFWVTALRELGALPKFVLPVRNPLEVAASLARRNGFTHPKGLLLWLRHVLDSERETRETSRAFVSYGDVLRDWRSVADAISEDIELSWPRAGHRAAIELDRFLSPEQRHHDFSIEELIARDDVLAWVKETYALLLDACRVRESPDPGRLDEVSAALADADLAYGPVLAESQLRAEELRDGFESERTRLEAEHAEQIAEIQSREAVFRSREADSRGQVAAFQRQEQRHGPLRALRAPRLAQRPRYTAIAAWLRSLSQLTSWILNPTSAGRPRHVWEFLVLRRSALIDPEFYLQRNPDVARAGMDPLMHYIEHGARAQLDPSPSFNTAAYVAEHPELSGSRVNPLYHFQRTGRDRRPRRPS